MKQINIDIETYSGTDLSKAGVYKYVDDPSFTVLLFSFSIDEGPVECIQCAKGEKIPEEVTTALQDETVIKVAFNAAFERVCIGKYIGAYLPPDSWRCTMVASLYLGLPGSLAAVGAVLGLEKQKLTEGKELIKYFSVPCKPTKSNGGRTRNLPEHDPEKWDAFVRYNIRDVETEMGIGDKVSRFPVPDYLWQQYILDQRINDIGIEIDMTLARQAIRCDEECRERYLKRATELTSLENPNSPIQLKEWLIANGAEVDSLAKKEVTELLKSSSGDVKEVLQLRQLLSKSSVKKYAAMEACCCSDGRAHGLLQFYGANRTGRWAGRLIQVQNLPQNHIPDLEVGRSLIRGGYFEAAELLYDSVPDLLSQLIRTAFVPREGCQFLVADFSAVEARALSWMAGEKWRMDVFAENGDIYCMSASQMFGVPVEKHGVNGHLRQKGKIAELACIAEGQLVLTDQGLVPIENITTDHLLWDGESWVMHDGVIYKGEREVITYEGLTATADHLVWVKGEQRPVRFGVAAASGAHLVQTGDGGRAIRLGEDFQSGKKVEQKMEPLLRLNRVPGLWKRAMAESWKFAQRKVKGLSALFAAKTDPTLARPETDSSKTEMRESQRSAISQLWRKGNPVQLPFSNGGGTVSYTDLWDALTRFGIGPDRQRRELRRGEPEVCAQVSQSDESKKDCAWKIRSSLLALFRNDSEKKTVRGDESGTDYSRCGEGCGGEAKMLEANKRTARLYDIRNAGRHHRFTVSGKLVHNCGYGGSVGALIAMGALDQGLSEEELKPIVDSWRSANPKIVQFWWDVDRAIITAVKERKPTHVKCFDFRYESGFLIATLPSGRSLYYAKPRVMPNEYGRDSLTYEGAGSAKHWERIESYGPKVVENICQGFCRDLLAEAMQRLDDAGYRIVMHVHDEVVIEAPMDADLNTVCEIMSRTPSWAPGLVLSAAGYTCPFYQKD